MYVPTNDRVPRRVDESCCNGSKFRSLLLPSNVHLRFSSSTNARGRSSSQFRTYCARRNRRCIRFTVNTRYSLEFSVLPHSSLLLLPVMQTRSRSRAVATPRVQQSVAALLPEEIIDSILLQLGYDYSTPAWYADQFGRSGVLSGMSVVAEGWSRPARRLLFRTVKVAGWKHLQERPADWVGKQVRRLEINDSGMYGVECGKLVRAIVELLKKLPNLRHLSLIGNYKLSPFDNIDFSPMQSAVLPQLSELEISDVASPRSIIFALLTASGHRIRRLSVHCSADGAGIDPVVNGQQLDFRGNLRYLSTYGAFYQRMLDPSQVALDGLAGLEELELWSDAAVETTQREGGLIRTIAPTLRTLTIHPKKGAWLTDLTTPLSSLTRLTITNDYDAIPLPFLRRLPPALTSLRFTFDSHLHAAFALWTATPALVPASLKSIEFSIIRNITTFQQLPRVDTLQTTCLDETVGLLRQLTPGTLPFKTLKIKFFDERLSELNSVTAECQRLGLVFCQDHDT